MDRGHNQALHFSSSGQVTSRGKFFVSLFEHLSSQTNLTLDLYKLETSEALFKADLSL